MYLVRILGSGFWVLSFRDRVLSSGFVVRGFRLEA
jgi:hypothetical protein